MGGFIFFKVSPNIWATVIEGGWIALSRIVSIISYWALEFLKRTTAVCGCTTPKMLPAVGFAGSDATLIWHTTATKCLALQHCSELLLSPQSPVYTVCHYIYKDGLPDKFKRSWTACYKILNILWMRTHWAVETQPHSKYFLQVSTFKILFYFTNSVEGKLFILPSRMLPTMTLKGSAAYNLGLCILSLFSYKTVYWYIASAKHTYKLQPWL